GDRKQSAQSENANERPPRHLSTSVVVAEGASATGSRRTLRRLQATVERAGRCITAPERRSRRSAPIPSTPVEPLRIGVLAVQGNFREHAAMLRTLGADVVEVRKPEQLEDLDGLVIPGGESTTFTRLMRLYGLDEAVRSFAAPVFGTCAGMIVLDRDHL